MDWPLAGVARHSDRFYFCFKRGTLLAVDTNVSNTLSFLDDMILPIVVVFNQSYLIRVGLCFRIISSFYFVALLYL